MDIGSLLNPKKEHVKYPKSQLTFSELNFLGPLLRQPLGEAAPRLLVKHVRRKIMPKTFLRAATNFLDLIPDPEAVLGIGVFGASGWSFGPQNRKELCFRMSSETIKFQKA